MKPPLYSQRQQRIAALINSVLVEILQSRMILKNYTGNCPITLTKVSMSADLKIADCYFTPFNTTMQVAQIQKLLDDSSSMIRKIATDKINLKYSPQIKFHYDKGYDNTNEVEEILKKINQNIDTSSIAK
jgi:ribosome-binding factor A